MKLKINNKAPNFKLSSTDGNIFELNKTKKKNIILYFYHKDDTHQKSYHQTMDNTFHFLCFITLRTCIKWIYNLWPT